MIRPLALGLIAAVSLHAGPAAAETLLRLSETAKVSVPPDDLVASLHAGADAASATAAQEQVNTKVARAIARAHQIPGVQVSTGTYNVWHQTQPKDNWHADQGLEIHGPDGAALLSLAGELQAQGLAMQRLAWRLKPETERHARSEATKAALSHLRARAEEAAGLLGLRFASFREVRLDAGRGAPVPGPRMLAAAAQAPSAEAEDVAVEASVEADAVLLPP
jgi:uncharacterized protein